MAAAFLIDIHLGITAWLAAATHEVPRELGDFSILAHGGWSKHAALLDNFLSGLTFLLCGILVDGLTGEIHVAFLIPFAAESFLSTGAANLVPEIKTARGLAGNLWHFAEFAAGMFLLALLRVWFPHDL